MKYLLMLLAASAALLAGCQTAPSRVSILGDSYSTFKGCIPEGNAIYYPRGEGNDVTRAEECWWYQVIENIGGQLEANESWSGSTLCNGGRNGADYSTWSFIARDGKLGNPDIILVCGGTNDSWQNVPVGEYKWSDWSYQELLTFRPGMARLLSDLQGKYPKAKVYFILNSGLRSEINDSVHAVCEHYGVPCIDLVDIDKQLSHPSVAGMKAFADQVTSAISE